MPQTENALAAGKTYSAATIEALVGHTGPEGAPLSKNGGVHWKQGEGRRGGGVFFYKKSLHRGGSKSVGI